MENTGKIHAEIDMTQWFDKYEYSEIRENIENAKDEVGEVSIRYALTAIAMIAYNILIDYEGKKTIDMEYQLNGGDNQNGEQYFFDPTEYRTT